MNEGWVDAEASVNKQYIGELTKDFDDYVKKSMLQFLGSYRKSGDTVFLGRNCTVYSLKLKIVNFVKDYELIVDNDTGICMSNCGTSSVNDKETKKSSFECVSFRTDGLDFLALTAAEGFAMFAASAEKIY